MISRLGLLRRVSLTFSACLSRLGHAFRLRGPLAADPTAQRLNILLWVLVCWFVIGGLLVLPLNRSAWFWTMQNQWITDAAYIGALVLLQRGRFRAACMAYLTGVGYFATHVMALNGGIRSNAQVLYVTLPISAAWLLGYEAAVWVAVACIGGTLVFAFIELAGVTLPRKIPGTPIGAWEVFVMACWIGVLPVAQILRDLRAALKRLGDAEEQSHRAMNRLRSEIEEHMRAEQALRESQERFRIAADTAPVMIWARDANLNATFFNKVWLEFTGRTAEQESGVGWTGGIHPDDLKACLAELSSAHADRRDFQSQFRLRRADGEYRLVLCHGVPRFEVDRTFNGYIASCVDITDLRRGEQEALARQKWESLGVLASGIAHDFNNLLGSIRALSELLMDELQNSPARETLLNIDSIVTRASEIVQQLMVYAGQESAEVELLELAAVLREMIFLVNISASKTATLEVDLPDGLPMIRANVTQIRQVILNLVTNAAEALNGRNGTITIRLSQVELKKQEGLGRYLRLEVSDTGCGMTEQIRAGIFDPFFSTKGAGRGLGLAAVQGIIRSHGGQISVTSALGSGSRFDILLPCATELRTAPDNSGTPVLPHHAGGFAYSVLMIEDEEALRQAIARSLRSRGLRVFEAGDGAAAVEVFREHAVEIDVALLDLTLPGLSGKEALERLRRIRPEVKVIITSAYGRDQALSAVSEGASRPYIRKPYRVNELLEVIRNACSEELQPARVDAGTSSSS